MWRLALACGCVLLVGYADQQKLEEPPSMRDFVYLTREGCVNTATMRTRFDEALSALGWPRDYPVIDADTLPGTDARRGYGTPTILYKNVDLFGMPQPATQNDAPT